MGLGWGHRGRFGVVVVSIVLLWTNLNINVRKWVDDALDGALAGNNNNNATSLDGRLRYKLPTLTPEQQSALDKLLKTHSPVCNDKLPMLRVLAASGANLTVSLCEELPLWSSVVALYGEGPVVLGLEQCTAYRDMIATSSHPPRLQLAGLWNTGSTALSRTFLGNLLDYDDSAHIRTATVPWGKHTPLYLKDNNTYPPENKQSKHHVLPVLIVRDPARWMVSMCKTPYQANWTRGHHDRCPNLIATKEERDLVNGRFFTVSARNMQSYWRYLTRYESLADMWSTFNGDYLHHRYNTRFRLIIRTEDMVYYPEQVMRVLADCAGLPMRETFRYWTHRAKGKSSTTFESAMSAFAADRHLSSLTDEERGYLETALDPALMHVLQYHKVI